MSYNFSTYSKMLENALSEGYLFAFFSSLDVISKYNSNKICLLRHDVDIDASAALAMAKLEYEVGVKSTYFYMLRSPVYNIFSRFNHRMVEGVLELGHEVGLHYDQGFDVKRGLTPEETKEQIDHEVFCLERLFGISISAVSFHQPGESVLNGKIDTGKLVNTYDKKRLHEFSYYSDSNRCFSLSESGEEKDMIRSFNNDTLGRIQLLIHPVWWYYDDITTEDVWDRALENNFFMMQGQFLDTERAYGDARTFTISYK